jgi:hypothetical protein
MDGMNKVRQVVQSRKFWAATVILGMALGLWQMDEITGEELAQVMAIAGGIYIGAVALEDGLRSASALLLAALGRQLMRDPAPGPEPVRDRVALDVDEDLLF